MGVFVQHGYGKGKKIEKAIKDNDISGIVLSPKGEKLTKLTSFADQLRKLNSDIEIVFDPQFYLCAFLGDVSVGKLVEYPYFETNLTRSYLSNPDNIHTYVKNIIEFEKTLSITSFCSPTIRFNDFNDKDSQIALSFANETISQLQNPNNLYITLCISEEAFTSIDKTNDYLDLITLFDIKGFYLIINRNASTSRPIDEDPAILSNIMYFIYILSIVNNYDLIMGYSDLISIPLAAVSNANFASGWFNNLKTFKESNFIPSEGGRRPRKRYTSGVLMNSLLLIPEISSLYSLNDNLKLVEQIMTKSKYNNFISPRLKDNEWNDEVSCLHNWHVINSLVSDIQSLSNIQDRVKFLEKKINNGNRVYDQLLHKSIQLEYTSQKYHLDSWKESIQLFSSKVGI